MKGTEAAAWAVRTGQEEDHAFLGKKGAKERLSLFSLILLEAQAERSVWAQN